MKDEALLWVEYAEENYQSARLLLEQRLFNPCLQNVQQSVEKALKAVVVNNSISFCKTHDVLEINNLLLLKK